jgi:hypothetical protein
MKRAASLALLSAVAIATSCKDPTEIVVDVRTNVPYRTDIVTSFTVGTPGQTEGAFPTTETRAPFSPAGDVGSLVVVPGNAKDSAVSVKVVMGIGREARDCTTANAQGCIIARRTLRYVPHTRLDLPITLYSACIGVPCDPDTTCNILGQCVPADVGDASACAGGVCDVPGGNPPPAGSTVAAVDVAPDASPGGDAAPKDSGGSDAPAESGNDGGGGVPGHPTCPTFVAGGGGSGPTCTAGDVCCEHANETFGCAPSCGAGDIADYECSGGDCASGLFCCLSQGRATCRTSADCDGRAGTYVCTGSNDCPGTKNPCSVPLANDGMGSCGSTM